MGKTNIFIRAIDKEFVDIVRARTGKTAGTKAFAHAAQQYLEQCHKIEALEWENRRLLGLLQAKQLVFNKLVPLCKQITEIAGQNDLFE